MISSEVQLPTNISAHHFRKQENPLAHVFFSHPYMSMGHLGFGSILDSSKVLKSSTDIEVQ